LEAVFSWWLAYQLIICRKCYSGNNPEYVFFYRQTLEGIGSYCSKIVFFLIENLHLSLVFWYNLLQYKHLLRIYRSNPLRQDKSEAISILPPVPL
jgi:hypothetical protein